MLQLHVRQPNRVHQFWPFPAINEVSRLVDSVFSDATSNSSTWQAPLDLIEGDQELKVRLEVPGMRAEDLDIQIDQKRLLISGEKYDSYESDSPKANAENESENDSKNATVEAPAAKFHHRETRYGKFTRIVTLPDGINTEAIKADYNNGVLVVTLPKIPVEPVKKIQVNAS